MSGGVVVPVVVLGYELSNEEGRTDSNEMEERNEARRFKDTGILNSNLDVLHFVRSSRCHDMLIDSIS